MLNQICWLPSLELFEDHANDWTRYQAVLYAIFYADFIDTKPSYDGLPVYIRKHPIEHGKEEAFFHVTCQDYDGDGERVPDLRRCERIRWVRSFIENYNCDSALCPKCEGVKLWEMPYGSHKRVHILLEEEKYMVVIEPREQYCLLITAFYFNQERRLRKTLEKYRASLQRATA